MPKRILEDIKPISRAPRRKADDVEVPVHVVKALPREVPFEPSEPRPTSRYALWYIAAACVIAFLFSLSFLFERANVAITPKSVPVAFDATDTYAAEKDSVQDGVIVYSQMTLSGDESIKLPSTSSKTESQAATGTVVLYNAYTTTPYSLIATTRLATPDGKVYRLKNKATIPGYKGSGASLVPGSVEAVVTADAVGEASNIATGDFNLPAFAGKPQYEKIYARTKTSIAGGTSGVVYTISADAANAALGTLQDKLRASLLAKAKVQVPDGYLLYDGATVFSTDANVAVPYSKEPDVPLALHGTLTAYIIREDTLVAAIAAKSVSQYAGEPVAMPAIASLVLSPIGNLNPAADTSFSFSFAGQASVVWVVDPATVQTLLAGRKKNEFETLIAGVASVERAAVVIKPFWKRTFPEDKTKIAVKVSEK
jgi:hypothetical protein